MHPTTLLSSSLESKLPPLYATEDIPFEDKTIVAKFFTPDSSWTWYAVEGERQADGEYDFFGLVCGHHDEWGYFRLSDLETARGPLGLPIERDLFWTPTLVRDVPELAYSLALKHDT